MSNGEVLQVLETEINEKYTHDFILIPSPEYFERY